MRPEDRDEAWLWDMLASCERLAQMRSTVTLAEVLDSDDLQDIALRRLTVLGEAARQVSPEAKARWANVPWSSVIAPDLYIGIAGTALVVVNQCISASEHL